MFYNNVQIKKYARLCLFLASEFASSNSASTCHLAFVTRVAKIATLAKYSVYEVENDARSDVC